MITIIINFGKCKRCRQIIEGKFSEQELFEKFFRLIEHNKSWELIFDYECSRDEVEKWIRAEKKARNTFYQLNAQMALQPKNLLIQPPLKDRKVSRVAPSSIIRIEDRDLIVTPEGVIEAY